MPDRLNWNQCDLYDRYEQKIPAITYRVEIYGEYAATLDWTITSALSANVNWTLYGKQTANTCGVA